MKRWITGFSVLVCMSLLVSSALHAGDRSDHRWQGIAIGVGSLLLLDHLVGFDRVSAGYGYAPAYRDYGYRDGYGYGDSRRHRYRDDYRYGYRGDYRSGYRYKDKARYSYGNKYRNDYRNRGYRGDRSRCR